MIELLLIFHPTFLIVTSTTISTPCVFTFLVGNTFCNFFENFNGNPTENADKIKPIINEK